MSARFTHASLMSGIGGLDLGFELAGLRCGRQADQIDHEISATVEERNALPEHVWRPGIVLDPFLGSGTVCQVAQQLGLRSIGIEMNPDGERIIRQRLWLPEGGTLFSDEDLGFAFNHFQ